MRLFADHIKGLVDFAGRENREPFWLWVLICYVFQGILWVVISIPLTSELSMQMQQLAGGDPHRFDDHPEILFHQMQSMMMPMMRAMMTVFVVLAIISLCLLAAAIVRRLHDTARSGWWAAPVLALHVLGPILFAAIFPQLFGIFDKLPMDNHAPDDPATQAAIQAAMAQFFPLFGLIWAIQMAGLVLTIVLIIFMVQPGTWGENRFGPDPLDRR